MGFNSEFKGLSDQDSQQQGACRLTKISQHGKSVTPHQHQSCQSG